MYRYNFINRIRIIFNKHPAKAGLSLTGFFIFIFLISGCTYREEGSSILRLRLKEDPTTFDPVHIVDVAGGSVSAKLYSGLVKLDDNCKIVPDIAESWDISEDGLTYKFKLHKDIKFSDGSPLNSDTIKKSFERIIKESPRKWIFNKVKEFKVIDDFNIHIILKEPFSPFLSILTMPNAYISPDGKVGTGPYKLISWEHDHRIFLEPNPFYSGEPAKVKGIEYNIIPEEFTAKAEFDLGNLDIIEVSPTQWADMGKVSVRTYQAYSQVGLNIYYIGFNCKKPLFKDIRVRQAFNYAVDKKGIIKNLLQRQAEPAWGPVPPGILKTDGCYYYTYLPNKAKKLLRNISLSPHAESGVRGEPLKLYVRAQAQAIQIAEIIQHYLKKVDIELKIIPLEWSAFKKAVNEGEPDIFLMSWWADYPDPENFLFPTFHSGNIGAGGNRAQYENKIIDKLIEESQRELDPNKRERLYIKLQRYINRQAPWLFLWHTKELFIAQPWIKGFKLYPVYNSDKGTDIEIQKSKIKNQN